MRTLNFILIALLCSVNGFILAQVPQTMSYQGVLTDADGNAVADGNYDLTLALYNAASGGTAQWMETQSVAVVNGVFNIILGSVSPLELPFDTAYWLGIQIGTDDELQPRTELTAVPYSLNARSVADSVVTGSTIANSTIVRSLNGLTDHVILAAEGGATVTADDNRIVINAGSGTGTSGWSLTGNAGLDTSNFIGTLDTTAFTVRVNNRRAIRIRNGIDPEFNTGFLPTIIGGAPGNEVMGGMQAGGSFIGGGGSRFAGLSNKIEGGWGAIVGGRANFATGFGFVGGGNGNRADGIGGSAAGGQFNRASGRFAAVAGGESNRAVGDQSTIPGGESNRARGNHSFAAGLRAHANHAGSFVWSDATATAAADSFFSTGENQFLIRAAGGVGIGTTTPNEQLEITGNFRLPATSADSGIIFSGSDRFIHNFGTERNFFAGVNAGNLAMTGFDNTAIGYRANDDNSSGNFNTSLGSFALDANTEGSSNTAIGRSALAFNLTGKQNTAVGQSALLNTRADNNTAVGYQALINGSTGNSNTAIGSGSDVSANNLSNATAIGANAVVDASNKIRLGDETVTLVETAGTVSAAGFVGDGSGLTNLPSSPWTISGIDIYFDNGNVGIGTNNPTAPLTVNGKIVANNGAIITGSGDSEGMYVGSAANGIPDIYLGGNGSSDAEDDGVIASDPKSDTSDLMFISNDDVIFKLDADASEEATDFEVRGFKDQSLFRVDENGDAELAGTLTEKSDRQSKTNIAAADVQAILAKLEGLPIATWAYINTPDVKHIGPMAQDFHAAFKVGSDETSISTVDRDGVALAAIQALHQLLQAKERRIADLESRLNEIERRLAK